MNVDPQRYHRRSIRLKGYDYSIPGAYFITIVTHLQVSLFGEVVVGEMRVNQYGKIAHRAWMDLPSHYPQVTLDAFIVMPNHVHGIVLINEMDEVDRGRGGSQTLPSELGGLIIFNGRGGGSLRGGEKRRETVW